MSTKLKTVLFAVVGFLVMAVPAGGGGDAAHFDYHGYGAVLTGYVDDAGMVYYKGLKAERKRLDGFIESLEQVKRDDYDEWGQEEKIAFWVNTYNGLTLKAIVDHYPIKSSFFKSLTYPKNSIRQIDGVWDKLKFNVMGKPVTLDHIEHNILRKQFDEPRIHVALVCAAMGCPALRNEPYTGAKLSKQLDDQAKVFMADGAKFRIDTDKGIWYLSSIFKWFTDDFVSQYGKDGLYGVHANPVGAVLRFAYKYMPDDVRMRKDIDSRTYRVVYLDYDWSLNERKKEVVDK